MGYSAIASAEDFYFFCVSNHIGTLPLFQILHLFTNPMIFVSQCFLLDQTPAVFGLKVHGFKVNAAFFYLLYLCFYAFLLDVFSGFINLAYSIFLYSLVPKFGNWVTRVVGVKWTNATAFVIYFISQYSQILIGHEIIENFYDWNIYHVSTDFPCLLFSSANFPSISSHPPFLQVFPIQQLLTVWNIMRVLRLYPELIEASDAWLPVMRECMGTINFEDCVMP